MFETPTEFFLKTLGLYPSRFLLRIQVIHVVFGITALVYTNFSYYFIKHPGSFKFDIYFVVDIIQGEVFIILQIFFYYRIHKLSSLKFYESIFKYFRWRLNEKSQKRLHLRIMIITMSRITRMILYFPDSQIYTLATASCEIVLSTSDFIVVLLFENLIDKQKVIQYQILNDVNGRIGLSEKITEMLKIENFILRRFSLEIFITIAYNYFQIIVCLYWTFIRIKFTMLQSRGSEFSIHIFDKFSSNH